MNVEPSLEDEILEKLRSAKRIGVLTGAGVSAESGVPTFRDQSSGLWAKYDPTELATPEAFERDPKLVWDWYRHRRAMIGKVEPNAGHTALAELEDKVDEFLLVTQNVDGLHRRAGSKSIIEVHGDILKTRCNDCRWESPRDAADLDEEDRLPRCDECGGMLRPGVVWFGESLPVGAFEEALSFTSGCDLFLSVGTSAVVYPAAALPFQALEQGAYVIEVNPSRTELSASCNAFVGELSGEVLPRWLRSLGGGT